MRKLHLITLTLGCINNFIDEKNIYITFINSWKSDISISMSYFCTTIRNRPLRKNNSGAMNHLS